MPFCDTSVIAKLYVPEAESPLVRALMESGEPVYLSRLAQVELMSVFHRRLREGKWSRSEFRLMSRQLAADDIGGLLNWLPLDEVVLASAARIFASLPQEVFLRSADCIHLVTALHHRFGEILTFDAHQAQAAPILGLKPVKPS